MRGRSYTPSPSPPPRGYGRRRGRSRDLPNSLLVRNLRLDCRPEDLRRSFEQFGPLKDVYLPRDFYTGKPRGFGFVQYSDPHDAVEAKYQMDGRVLHGRELAVVFAEENRKKPSEMRHRDRGGGRGGRFRDRRSPPRYSRSPPPRHARLRSHSRDDYSPPPKRRHYSRSISPQEKRYNRERSRSRSQSPAKGQSRSPSRSRSRSPRRLSRSQSPPVHDEHPPREVNGDRSLSR